MTGKSKLRRALFLAALTVAPGHVGAQDQQDSVRRDTLAFTDNSSAIRVCGGGDVMLGSDLDTTWVVDAAVKVGRPVTALPVASDIVAPLVPLVADADVVLINVEGAIGSGTPRAKCRPDSRFCYAFRQPPDRADALAGLSSEGVVVGNLANNHAMDAGGGGFALTRQLLGAAGVFVTGADTLATAVAVGSDTLAVLGFSTAQAGPDPRRLDAVARHVARAVERHGRVVVTMHMGAEGVGAQRTRDTTEIYLGENRGNVVAFARTAADAGASLVLGHGPHVLRAAEWWNGKLLVYSLGNLLTYGPFNLDEPRNHGGFACAVLDPDGGVHEAEIRSTLQRRPGIVAIDPSHAAAALIDSLSRLDFPATGVRLTGGRIASPTKERR